MMTTAIIIRSKGIFVFSYSARPNKSILMILMSKIFLKTKKFSKTIKPFFSNKGLNTNNIYNACRKQQNSMQGRNNSRHHE